MCFDVSKWKIYGWNNIKGCGSLFSTLLRDHKYHRDTKAWILEFIFLKWRVGAHHHLHKTFRKWDITKRIKSNRNHVRRCQIRKHWYLFMATRFQLTEALGFTMRCINKSLSLKLLAKHTIRIRSSFLEKKITE